MIATTVTETKSETAEQQSSAVSLFVVLFALAAAACFAWATYHYDAQLSWALLGFVLLGILADIREVRLPLVGVVGMSFVPAMAALIVLGLWPALIVAAVSGAVSAGFTRDPLKITFNIANYIVSMFCAGVVFLALVTPGSSLSTQIVPTVIATAVDFFANTAALAGVVALSGGTSAWTVWRQNYQWALPGYLAGASFALLAAWLYHRLGLGGLVLAVPPVVLIFFSYEVYVSRFRDRLTFSAERDAFHDELAASAKLHDDLRTAQDQVAAEIERAKRIQLDLLPSVAPDTEGLALCQRIEFLGEMGGDYYDYFPLPDGRLGIVCADVMGKGLAAALIMAMARSLLHTAVAAGKQPEEILSDVNDGLARDLQGQRLPYFMTMAIAVWDPGAATVTIAGGGHNPVYLIGGGTARDVASQGPALGVRPNLSFTSDVLTVAPGDLIALYTDGLTEARNPAGELFGDGRLRTALATCQRAPGGEEVDCLWNAVAHFRDGAAATDDATLLLGRFT